MRALRDFYLACVAPYWSRIVATFHADVAERIPVLATRGLAGVLSTLHDDLAWRDNTLVRSWRTGDCSLGGCGLKLLPSALWTGPPLVSGHLREFGGNALIYPARSPVPIYGASQSCDLAGLMGHTRAAVLGALRTPRSTVELAACVGTSAPSASGARRGAACLRPGANGEARPGRQPFPDTARPEPAQRESQRSLRMTTTSIAGVANFGDLQNESTLPGCLACCPRSRCRSRSWSGGRSWRCRRARGPTSRGEPATSIPSAAIGPPSTTGLVPRMLRANTDRDLSVELFDITYSTPVFLAPIG